MKIKFKKINSLAKLPTRGSEGAAGLDLYSIENCKILPGERKIISTGLAIELPFSYEGQIRPRSGMAAKSGITVLNTPGTIDYGYTGEIKVILINLSNSPYEINPYDRIAQLVIQKVEIFDPVEVLELEKTERGDGGFGSTGN